LQLGSSIPAYPQYIQNDVDGRCVTPSEKPSRNPAHVHIQSNNDKSLIVNWEVRQLSYVQLPAFQQLVRLQPLHRRDWNGPKLSYVLEYWPSNETSAGARKERIEDPYRESAVINDVPSYTDYTVKVWAENAHGQAVVAPRAVAGKSGESGECVKRCLMRGADSPFLQRPTSFPATSAACRSRGLPWRRSRGTELLPPV